MATLTYKEQVENQSPSAAGCSIDGGSVTRTWLLENPSANDLQTAITQILGSTTYAAGDGRLQRTPPLADPCYPYWYASEISSIRGLGKFTTINAQPQLEVPSFSQFALYDQYWITTKSTPRSYPVLKDSKIRKTNGSWFNDNGTKQTFKVVSEWDRFTDYELLPPGNDATITAQIGTMQFRSTSPGVGTAFFPGQAKMYLPNQVLRVAWAAVPYRYVTSLNSYIAFFPGRINQNDFTIMGNVFPAGSLLYLGYNPRKYTPPVQQTVQIDAKSTAFSTDKLCNVELIFLYTRRTASDLPAAPANGNFIMAGHNLHPWMIDRQFHFAMSNPDPSTFSGKVPTPAWYSFPAELLFYDPDGKDAYQVSTATA